MLAVTGNSLSVWSAECGACGLSPHWNAEFLSSFLTSSCLDLCRDKNAVYFRVSSIIMGKEYKRVPLQYQVPVLAASCIHKGAHSQHVEKWTGCRPGHGYLCESALHLQVWACVWNGLVSVKCQCLNMIIFQDRLPGWVRWGWLALQWVKPLQCKPFTAHKTKKLILVPSTDLPIVQDPHQSPSDLEQALSAEGGSGKKQERRQLQTMSSVPRQR